LFPPILDGGWAIYHNLYFVGLLYVLTKRRKVPLGANGDPVERAADVEGAAGFEVGTDARLLKGLG